MNKWLQMQEHDVVFSRGQRDPGERVVLGIRACSDPRTWDLTVNLDEPLFFTKPLFFPQEPGWSR